MLFVTEVEKEVKEEICEEENEETEKGKEEETCERKKKDGKKREPLNM